MNKILLVRKLYKPLPDFWGLSQTMVESQDSTGWVIECDNCFIWIIVPFTSSINSHWSDSPGSLVGEKLSGYNFRQGKNRICFDILTRDETVTFTVEHKPRAKVKGLFCAFAANYVYDLETSHESNYVANSEIFPL